ncbi:hypothetical protein [Labilibaculum euxinus]
MKRILVILFICDAITTFGQTQIESSPIYYKGSYVGVGTPNPLVPLHSVGYFNMIQLRMERTGSFEGFCDLGGSNGDFRVWSGGYAKSHKFIVSGIDGNVGIGTLTPRSRLDIGKSVGANNGLRVGDYIELNERETVNNAGIISFNAVIDDGDVSKFKPVWSGSSTASGMVLTMESGGCSNLDFYGNTWGIDATACSLSEFTHVMRLNVNGSVGIGTQNTNGYKLAVNGKIRAKEIKVEANWADFVFEEDYKLRSLNDLDVFIKESKHLPEIPTQDEVKKDGVSLGEMNAKLLQKIEELTLYVIEQQKQIQELQYKVNQIENSKN